jgi:hypothetical protein
MEQILAAIIGGIFLLASVYLAHVLRHGRVPPDHRPVASASDGTTVFDKERMFRKEIINSRDKSAYNDSLDRPETTAFLSRVVLVPAFFFALALGSYFVFSRPPPFGGPYPEAWWKQPDNLAVLVISLALTWLAAALLTAFIVRAARIFTA